MKHATSRELYEYWNRVRGSERAPLRSAIEPSDIRRILGEMFILEVRRARQLPGPAGRDARVRDLLPGDQGHQLPRPVVGRGPPRDGNACRRGLRGRRGGGRDRRRPRPRASKRSPCELILLPLRHGGPTFDRVLGSLAVMERPYWLGNEPVVRQTIASLRLIWPDEAPTFHAPPSVGSGRGSR